MVLCKALAIRSFYTRQPNDQTTKVSATIPLRKSNIVEFVVGFASNTAKSSFPAAHHQQGCGRLCCSHLRLAVSLVVEFRALKEAAQNVPSAGKHQEQY